MCLAETATVHLKAQSLCLSAPLSCLSGISWQPRMARSEHAYGGKGVLVAVCVDYTGWLCVY